MLSLRQRRRLPEWMDRPDLSPACHVAALRGLARINWWSRSAGILWPPLAALARRLGRPLRVLDVATGAGDVPLRLWRRAARAGLDFRIDGCDLSPTAVAYARDAADRAGAAVHFFQHDALNGAPPPGYDAVVNSLFLHHLDEAEAVTFLRRLAGAAEFLVLVNDLERSAMGLALAHVAVRLLSRSAVVHYDGPRSVMGAFTRVEALALAERAGLYEATAEWRWPFRYLLTWVRS
jgi:2-polyprenyl-3-methyl-5-hydroxy-6-metoxy-1,4-benzoquinol methylase